MKLKSKDARENPVVDHRYLEHPLDMLVMSEACRFANEVVMEGSTTKGVVKGSWPPGLKHHEYTKREEWEGYVREHATTCKLCSACMFVCLVAGANRVVSRLPRFRHLRDG